MSAWRRIDAWLSENAPEVLAQLLPPAKPEALAKLEQLLGQKLPAAIVEAYRAHDGALEDATTIFGGVRVPAQVPWARFMYWLSVERAREQVVFMRDLGEWPDNLLPIAEDAGGNLIVVDLKSGVVSAWDHEDWSTVPLAKDFAHWMNELADDMEGSLVVVDEEDEDFPALMLLDKPAVAPNAPNITPDRPARVLLEVMVERKMLALARKGNIEPLIKELTKALDAKNPQKKREAVVSIFEDNDAVDELFADDETIDELLEELG
jgi:cell wall assembly regulator SMI1